VSTKGAELRLMTRIDLADETHNCFTRDAGAVVGRRGQVLERGGTRPVRSHHASGCNRVLVGVEAAVEDFLYSHGALCEC